MTISPSPYSGSLTVQFNKTTEFKLYPWFDEAFTAHAHLKYPLFGISPPMQRLFPGCSPTSDEKSARVFAATLDFSGPDDGVPETVCLKLARGVDEVVHLSHEASAYRRELAKLWGIAVPRMYGFFVGHCDDAPVACLLLELCAGPNDLSDTEEFIRLAMQTVRKIHTLGVTQNSLIELRHFVMKDNNVLLVDFSRAIMHQCDAVPICSHQRVCLEEEDELEDEAYDCGELMAIAKENMLAMSLPPLTIDCDALVP